MDLGKSKDALDFIKEMARLAWEGTEEEFERAFEGQVELEMAVQEDLQQRAQDYLADYENP